jgi:hypothetical protein
MKGDSPRAHSRAVKKKNMKTNNQNQNSETPGLMNRIAQSSSQAWRGIFFRGPEQTKNKAGAEVNRWSVYVGDEHGEPVKTVYAVDDFRRASGLAKVMATDRKLELIHEAHPPVELEAVAA